MANTPSALKRVRQTERRTLRNRVYRSKMRTAERRLEEAVAQKDTAVITSNLQAAYKIIDKAAKRGVIHKNNAARRKSRLAHLAQSVSTAS